MAYFSLQYFLGVSPLSVRSFLIADFDNDGRKELALVIWKKGSFGRDKPFWLKRNDSSYGFHLFLYRIKDGLRPLWFSSRLAKPICDINVRERAGKSEIEVEEGVYNPQGYSCQKTEKTSWQWDGWGFKRI